MIRAVLDSSVLISAFLTPAGVSGQVLDAFEQGAFTLCLSKEILGETRTSLIKKVKRIRNYYAYPDEQVDRFLANLAALGELALELPMLRVVPDDPKDDMIVATAVKTKADYLVSGDRHLLSMEAYDGIQIITTRAFLTLIAPETGS